MSGHPLSLCGRRLRDVLILISGLMLEIRFGYIHIDYTIYSALFTNVIFPSCRLFCPLQIN